MDMGWVPILALDSTSAGTGGDTLMEIYVLEDNGCWIGIYKTLVMATADLSHLIEKPVICDLSTSGVFEIDGFTIRRAVLFE